MSTTYHKVVKAIARNVDILLVTRDNTGKKHILIVKGFSPYCFISEKQEYLLEDNNYVSKIIDDSFQNFWDGSSMLTAHFTHPSNVGRERNRIGNEILHQADVHYELACAVRKLMGRYIRINGNLDVPHIYIDQIYPMLQYEIEDMEFPDYDISWIDIEVLGDAEEFPDPKEADKDIISIVTNYQKQTIVWFVGKISVGKLKHKIYGLEAEVFNFDTCAEMVEVCYKYVNLCDVVIGWNVVDFDYEYLQNYSKKNNLNCDWDTVQWFNLQEAVAQSQGFGTKYLALKTIFEDLYMFKRHAWKYLPEIFQDYFTEEEGKNIEDRGKGIATVNKDSLMYKYIQYRKGQSGSDVKELYESGKHKELMFYNACDVWDMMMLDKVGGIDGLFNMFDGLQLMNMQDLFYHTSKIEPLALKFCYANRVAAPSKIFQQGHIEKGAIVHDPTQGRVLENVIVLDFSRFYVSIILAKEISPENKGDNPQKLYTIQPNGDSYEEPMFFLPALAKYLIDQRNYAEDRVLETTDIITKDYWKKQAGALKTLTSGLWGYIAQNGKIKDEEGNSLPKNKQKKAGRFYAEHVPNEILQESRNKTMELKKYMDETPIGSLYFNVVYGDTDATFLEKKTKSDLNLSPEVVAEEVNVFFKKLCEDQGYPYPILVKAEKMYDKLVLVSKKFYYGRIVWEDGKWLDTPKYDVKGMQAKRGDHSQFAKDFQYSIIQNHLAEGEKGIIKTIRNMNNRMEEGWKNQTDSFMESISMPFKVKRKLDKYDFGQKKFWSQSAKIWNTYAKENKLGIENSIKLNDKVFVMMIKYCGIPNLPIENGYLVFPHGGLVDWNKIEVDVSKMEDKTVKEKINNIMRSLGMEKNVITSLSKGKLTQKPRF